MDRQQIQEYISKQEAAKIELEKEMESSTIKVGDAFKRLQQNDDWNTLIDWITKEESQRVVLLRASKSADETLRRQLDDKITMIGEFNELITSIPKLSEMSKQKVKELEEYIEQIDVAVSEANK